MIRYSHDVNVQHYLIARYFVVYFNTANFRWLQKETERQIRFGGLDSGKRLLTMDPSRSLSKAKLLILYSRRLSATMGSNVVLMAF